MHRVCSHSCSLNSVQISLDPRSPSGIFLFMFTHEHLLEYLEKYMFVKLLIITFVIGRTSILSTNAPKAFKVNYCLFKLELKLFKEFLFQSCRLFIKKHTWHLGVNQVVSQVPHNFTKLLIFFISDILPRPHDRHHDQSQYLCQYWTFEKLNQNGWNRLNEQ